MITARTLTKICDFPDTLWGQPFALVHEPKMGHVWRFLNFPIILELQLSFKNTWKNVKPFTDVNKIWQRYPLTQKLSWVVVPMHQSNDHTSRLSIVVNCPWIPRPVRTVWPLVSEEGGGGDRPIWRQPRSQGLLFILTESTASTSLN